ncbi:hypothetical protein FOZ62_011255, partial [Perkinsus olseni]
VFMVLLVTVLPILFGINLSLVISGEETRLKAELTPEQMNSMNALIGINVTAPEPRTSVEVFSDLVEIENHATQQQSPFQLSVELTDWNVRVVSHVIQASPKPVW